MTKDLSYFNLLVEIWRCVQLEERQESLFLKCSLIWQPMVQVLEQIPSSLNVDPLQEFATWIATSATKPYHAFGSTPFLEMIEEITEDPSKKDFECDIPEGTQLFLVKCTGYPFWIPYYPKDLFSEICKRLQGVDYEAWVPRAVVLYHLVQNKEGYQPIEMTHAALLSAFNQSGDMKDELKDPRLGAALQSQLTSLKETLQAAQEVIYFTISSFMILTLVPC